MVPFQKALIDYTPFDKEEATSKNRILALLEETDIPFSRENLSGHITGSALVVNEQLTRTCLIKHKKLGMWLQPGGHCDGDPEVEQTALRETEEETGLTQLRLIPSIFDLDVHDIPEKEKNGMVEPAHQHHDVRYLIVANEEEQATIQEEEVDGLKWMSFEEAIKINPWRPFSRMIDKIMSERDQYLSWIK